MKSLLAPKRDIHIKAWAAPQRMKSRTH